MLGGLALVPLAETPLQPPANLTDRPNLVMGINVQVCWEKFANYWDVECGSFRWRAIDSIPPGGRRAVRREPIGVVAILGSTLTARTSRSERDLRRARRPFRPGLGWTCRTSTAHPAASSRRVRRHRSSGTSGCRAWPLSTPPATSTGSVYPVFRLGDLKARPGVPPRRPQSSGQLSATCRPSRSTSRDRARRSWRSTTTSCGSGSMGTGSRRTRARSPHPCPRRSRSRAVPADHARRRSSPSSHSR